MRSRQQLIRWLCMLALCVVTGCDILGQSFERPTLPGQLWVSDEGEKPYFYKYTSEQGFVQVSDRTHIPAELLALPDPKYDPSRSPDGKWKLIYDTAKKRYTVNNGPVTIVFRYFVFSPAEIAWSPDAHYIAYTADDDQGTWRSRIMILNLQNYGIETWIGSGRTPRWLAK